MRIRARPLPGPLPLGLCALCLHLLPALTWPAPAQPYSPSFAQGTHYFRRLLHQLDLQPLRGLEQLHEEPENKLLIVLGETDRLRRGFDLDGFVRRGGAVLLATDRDCAYPLRRFGVKVAGARVRVGRQSRFAYRKSAECVFILPGNRALPLFENLALEDEHLRVATNRPGYLIREPSCELPVLATFPPGCWTSDGHIISHGTLTPFAVGGVWGEKAGRILVLSDHSVFINLMMWQPDIDNFDFAYNCVNWLTNAGQRRQALFLEEGQIQESFEVPLQEPPLPPLPPLRAIVETVDKELGDLERDNAFNRALQNAERALMPPAKWERGLIVASTVALALFGLARLSQARQRPEKLAPQAPSDPARTAHAPSLFEQRQQSMVREGNFWEAARALARQGIESALGAPLPVAKPSAAAAAATPPCPPVPGSGWRSWRFRRRFRWLWRLAYGSEPVRVSSRRLSRLGQEIEAMKTVVARWGLPHRPPRRGGAAGRTDASLAEPHPGRAGEPLR